ncbi:hypothetical protein [Nocardioides sp. R-C-SC26]|uniref:hypothetical protein n=1 Tax=Nocardioides sp. R-C-SC26 TaxID=2870414 RepID=UPI001E3565D0|nr:hypothetical protein [Nocardioides sp. R-C-SC26]
MSNTKKPKAGKAGAGKLVITDDTTTELGDAESEIFDAAMRLTFAQAAGVAVLIDLNDTQTLAVQQLVLDALRNGINCASEVFELRTKDLVVAAIAESNPNAA